LKAGSPAYRISKSGINAVTRILADELTGTGILINEASPGRVQTCGQRAGRGRRL
jgi:NAD(P)-dependent dehydrogenase (short-subunit alcohol dehydrogenase family)